MAKDKTDCGPLTGSKNYMVATREALDALEKMRQAPTKTAANPATPGPVGPVDPPQTKPKQKATANKAVDGGGTGGGQPPAHGGGGGGSSGSGSGGSGGFGAWWNRQNLGTRVGLGIAIGILSILLSSSLTIWNNERIGKAQNDDAIEAARTELVVSKMKAEAAEFKRSIKPAPVTVGEVVRAALFACADSSVMMQNFASESNRSQEVELGKTLRFNPGCAWARFGYPITSLEGENYLIASEDSSERCGKIAPNNDTGGTCMALVNSRLGKRFRVIVREGGYFTAGGQNGN